MRVAKSGDDAGVCQRLRRRSVRRRGGAASVDRRMRLIRAFFAVLAAHDHRRSGGDRWIRPVSDSRLTHPAPLPSHQPAARGDGPIRGRRRRGCAGPRMEMPGCRPPTNIPDWSKNPGFSGVTRASSGDESFDRSLVAGIQGATAVQRPPNHADSPAGDAMRGGLGRGQATVPPPGV